MPKQFYMVLDFEANCKSEGSNDHEIIEWPCILVNAKTGDVISEFREFVLPVSRKPISQFIQGLTSLTNELIFGSGLDWADAVEKFETWFKSHQLSKQNCTVVTCGAWDLATMLPKQTTISGVKLSRQLCRLFCSWHNIKVSFKVTFPNANKSDIPGMLETLGESFQGRLHIGIDDCRNICTVCRLLAKHGVDVTATNQDSQFYINPSSCK